MVRNLCCDDLIIYRVHVLFLFLLKERRPKVRIKLLLLLFINGDAHGEILSSLELLLSLPSSLHPHDLTLYYG